MRNFWDKVTLTWDFRGLPVVTSVDRNGEWKPNLHNPRHVDSKADSQLYGIVGMEAVSVWSGDEHSRKGELRLTVHHIGKNENIHKDILTTRLKNALKGAEKDGRLMYEPSVESPKTDWWSDGEFLVRFNMGNGEHFCDAAIEIARTSFEALGAHDPNGYSLACFNLKRETLVRFDDGWMTFSHWLRMSHRLPIYGPEDLRT